ncbi:MAG: DUF481 domain-containing protein [Cellvibrio sp.]|uniref:DUF481 domain-containing protein n=1 Tax=Cellvibrio sp. TaxID=1965322 RepID=UPI0031B149E7
MKPFVILLWILASACAQAGVVELNNGDRLEGELVRVDGEHLIWKSTNFGEQWLKKNNIKNIQSSKPLKINGSKAACVLKQMDADDLVYQCENSSRIKRKSILTVKTLVPYEDYKKGAYVHRGKLNLWGAYSRGNEVRDEWNIQSEMEFRRGDFRHVVGGEFARASWNYSPAQERWNSRYSLDWFLADQWFWYNSALAGSEPNRGMANYRSLGTGAGYQFFENLNQALSLKTGAAYMDERYTLPANLEGEFATEDEFMAVRVATDFRYRLPWGVGFFHNNEVLQSTEDKPNWRLKTTTGFSSMILKRIYSEFKIDYWRDNEPQPTRKDKDTRMSLGVSYKW